MAGIRQNILTNLRTDLALINGAGSYTNTIGTTFKDVRALEDVSESEFDAAYVGTLDDVRDQSGEGNVAKWTLSIAGVIYFKSNTDTQNAGTIEAKCETFIEDLHTLDALWTNTIPTVDASSKKAVESVEIVTVEPYLNSGFPDRGTIYFEMKIIYYR